MQNVRSAAQRYWQYPSSGQRTLDTSPSTLLCGHVGSSNGVSDDELEPELPHPTSTSAITTSRLIPCPLALEDVDVIRRGDIDQARVSELPVVGSTNPIVCFSHRGNFASIRSIGGASRPLMVPRK